jgi:hypothetical protein
MSKIRNLQNNPGKIFWCPGCNRAHMVNTGALRWDYNGNPDSPTFSPSILVTYGGSDAGDGRAPPKVCHSFVRDGMIQFLGDCTHKLAKQTVPIPDWPHAPGTYGGIED